MKKRQGPQFTHFGSIPFIRKQYRQNLLKLQQQITQTFKQKNLHQTLKPNNPNLFHLTISMLTIPHKATQLKTQQILQSNKKQLSQIMQQCKLTTDKINYFTFSSQNKNKPNNNNNNNAKIIKVIYLDIKKDSNYEKLTNLIDRYIRLMLKQQILANYQLKDMHIEYDHKNNMFRCSDLHITLFRCQGLIQSQEFRECYEKIKGLYEGNMLQCDYVDISTRNQYDGTNFYNPLYRIQLRSKQKIQEENNSEILKKQQNQQNKI